MSSWADDADDYFPDTTTSPIIEDEKPTPTHSTLANNSLSIIEFGSPCQFSPLDVFKSDVEDYPFRASNKQVIFTTSDHYIQHGKSRFKPRAGQSWSSEKVKLFEESVLLKCQQYSDLQETLLRFDGYRIYELSGHPFWGGDRNEAGKALMRVILKLRQSSKQDKKAKKKETKKKPSNPFAVLACE